MSVYLFPLPLCFTFSWGMLLFSARGESPSHSVFPWANTHTDVVINCGGGKKMTDPLECDLHFAFWNTFKKIIIILGSASFSLLQLLMLQEQGRNLFFSIKHNSGSRKEVWGEVLNLTREVEGNVQRIMQRTSDQIIIWCNDKNMALWVTWLYKSKKSNFKLAWGHLKKNNQC